MKQGRPTNGRAALAAFLALLTAGCVMPEPIYDRVITPATTARDVVVRVKHLGVEDSVCLAEMKTAGPGGSNGQACNGLGSANGVACGRPGDTIAWTGQGRVTLTAISFAPSLVPDSVVCDDPSRLTGGSPSCDLLPPSGTASNPDVVYKYRVTYTIDRIACEVDPYIIVTGR